MAKPINRNPYELPQWERPDDYMGQSPDGDFIVYARSRDSDLLANTNFECIEAELRELDAGDFVYTFTASHWGVGWVEHLMLRRLCPDNLQARVYEIHAALSNYPVYSDSAYSEAEHEATLEYWGRLCTDRRIELCAEYGASIFASRHGRIPEPLYEQVRAWASE